MTPATVPERDKSLRQRNEQEAEDVSNADYVWCRQQRVATATIKTLFP